MEGKGKVGGRVKDRKSWEEEIRKGNEDMRA
jgi:hypothetical protein